MKGLKNKIKERSLNNNRNFITLCTFLAIMCIILSSCNPIVKTLGPLSSSSIEDSKKCNAFLWEYYPVDTKVYDAIDFGIKEVFAEKQYSYYSYKDLRCEISKDKFQIIIIPKYNLSKQKYFDLWVVENFDWHGNSGLVRQYKQGDLPPDTLVVRILKVDIGQNGLAGKDDKKEITSFVLRRK